ncbi:hypothetical protein [Azospirillum brasilense]|uniref:hypothetical protein n=1 Tax=Azospirillum brasilense TaxID=192 RepID=UPI0013B3C9D7|nr:hypothetical protein [Azospirillum brasilense]
MAMRVFVWSRAEIEDGAAEGADAVISVRLHADRGSFETLDTAMAQAVLGDVDAMLVLRCDDIGVPRLGAQRGPTDEQIATVIDFARAIRAGRPDATLAIHCEHGRSLSPALALAVLADELGPGREAEAAQRLLRLDRDGIMAPNPLAVRQADDRLWRYGALEAALAAAAPRFAAVRDTWSRVASPAGVRAAPRLQSNRKRRIRALDQDEQEIRE